jgi:hypothetical protein
VRTHTTPKEDDEKPDSVVSVNRLVSTIKKKWESRLVKKILITHKCDIASVGDGSLGSRVWLEIKPQ